MRSEKSSCRLIIRWELIVMLRKALLVGSFTVWSKSITLKIEIAALVLMTTTVVHRSYRPLCDVVLDKMEFTTLYFNSVVLVAGLGVFVTRAEQVSATVSYIIFVLLVIACCTVIVWMVHCIYVHISRDESDDDNDNATDKIDGHGHGHDDVVLREVEHQHHYHEHDHSNNVMYDTDC